jgi:hypothetical protein
MHGRARFDDGHATFTGEAPILSTCGACRIAARPARDSHQHERGLGGTAFQESAMAVLSRYLNQLREAKHFVSNGICCT